MTTEKEAMQELHDIRERIYEETKGLTPEERAALAKDDVDAWLADLGVALKREPSKERESVSH